MTSTGSLPEVYASDWPQQRESDKESHEQNIERRLHVFLLGTLSVLSQRTSSCKTQRRRPSHFWPIRQFWTMSTKPPPVAGLLGTASAPIEVNAESDSFGGFELDGAIAAYSSRPRTERLPNGFRSVVPSREPPFRLLRKVQPQKGKGVQAKFKTERRVILRKPEAIKKLHEAARKKRGVKASGHYSATPGNMVSVSTLHETKTLEFRIHGRPLAKKRWSKGKHNGFNGSAADEESFRAKANVVIA